MLKKIIIFALAVLPVSAFAALNNFKDLMDKATGVITMFIPVLLGGISLAFLYSVINFMIIGQGEEKKRAEAKMLIIKSVIGFAVFMSIWGIVAVIRAFFELPTSGDTPVGIPSTLQDIGKIAQ